MSLWILIIVMFSPYIVFLLRKMRSSLWQLGIRTGEVGYGHAKQELFSVVMR